MILPDFYIRQLLGIDPETTFALRSNLTVDDAPSMGTMDVRRHNKRREALHFKLDPLPELSAIQPASVDLRLDLSKGVQRLKKNSGETVMGPGVRHLPRYKHDDCVGVSGSKILRLRPGDCVLATTLERIEIGRGLSGHVSGKSSIGRVFVVVHATAGFLDPGFQGQITLEIKNMGHEAVTFLDHTPICQVVMSMLAEPAEKAYGDPSLGSRYFGQMGATEPRK